MNKTLIFTITLSIIGVLTQFLFGLQGGLYQLGFVIIGLFLYFLIMTVVDINLLLNVNLPINLIGLMSLIGLLLFGDATRGAQRWFFIGSFGLQPSMIFLPGQKFHCCK